MACGVSDAELMRWATRLVQHLASQPGPCAIRPCKASWPSSAADWRLWSAPRLPPQPRLAKRRPARLAAVQVGMMERHGMPGAAEGGWKVTGVPVPCMFVWSHRSHPPTPPTEAPPAEAQGDQPRPAEASGCDISSAPPAASVEAIMRRLSLLESRVGAQLHQIEAGMCAGGGCSSGGGSAPVSPLRSAAQGDPWAVHAQHGLAGSWSPPVGARSHSRAAQAAAVAAAAVWGSTNGTDGSEASLAAGSLPGGPKPPRAGWCGSPDGLPASPRIRTAAAARPASAGPGYGGYRGGLLEDGLSGYRAPSSCGPSRWAVG